jgi:DNA-binding MarR family transcriptional regulator
MAGEGLGSRETSLRAVEHELGVVIRRVRRAMADRAGMLDPAVSSAAYSMLAALMDSGPQRASTLADLFSIDKGAVSRHVQQLVDLGLIEREPDPVDGRASILTISEEGRRRMEEVAAERRASFDSRLADWSDDDLATFARTVERYNRSLSRPSLNS